jgi:copper/silver efflux system protein
MDETIVHLKPREEWRSGITREKLVNEMDEKLQMPGVTNIWIQPIKNRIEMLSTGIRTEVGVKIFGSDINELEQRSREVASALQTVPGAANVYAEQIPGSDFLPAASTAPNPFGASGSGLRKNMTRSGYT